VGEERWFVIVEFNQASGRPDGHQSLEIYEDLTEARDIARDMKTENRRDGRRESYAVYELVEVEDV
jgi:hypothetical protein